MKKIIMMLLILSFAPGAYANQRISLGTDEPSAAKENWNNYDSCQLLVHGDMRHLSGSLYYLLESGNIIMELRRGIFAFLKTESGENTLLGWSDEKIHKMTVEKDKELLFEVIRDSSKNYMFLLFSNFTFGNVWNAILSKPELKEELTKSISSEEFWNEFVLPENVIAVANTKIKFLEKTEKGYLIFSMRKDRQSEPIHVRCRTRDFID